MLKKIKKVLAVLLIISMAISVSYTSEIREVKANGTYLIKAEGTDTYLYAEGTNTMAGNLQEGDVSYYWIMMQKSDGTYWIQNQKTGGYMCLENMSGKVELLDTIYEVWDSSKWNVNPNASTNITNKWLSQGIRIDGTDVVYGGTAQKFLFVSTATEEPEPVGPVITGGYADAVEIPEPNEDVNSIGASMPYTRYDSETATLGGGAVIATSNDFARSNVASQASKQSYVRLPDNGAYAEWTMGTTGNGVTMRFTMPDTSNGMGQSGSLDVYVNGTKVKTVDLTSYFMWQYFPNSAAGWDGKPEDSPTGTGCFAFDEVHFKLDTSLKPGDKIRIQSSGANGLEYGVDFIETEETGAAIAQPANSLSITDFGAVANDGKDDYTAIRNCISSANMQGKDVYIPEGTFEIGQMWKLNASDMKITGAGKWYTNIQFTNANKSQGGISGSKADNIEFCNMYINSNLRSRYDEQAVYKCFMDIWSGGSYIHDIWEEHFECGFWLADYYDGDGLDYSDGIKIVNNRIRNNFADGVNFCQGTSNATVYNCNIRNNGDDGLAIWNNNYLDVKDETNNVFCYNTIDFIWRAGGIAIYGGAGHKIYNNYIIDTFMASGIHLNTNFDGYKYLNNTGIKFLNNILVRTGTSSEAWGGTMGAIDISGQVRSITFENTYIYDSQHDAIKLTTGPSGITFNNLCVYNAGVDGKNISGNSGALLAAESSTASPLATINGLKYADIADGDKFYGSSTNITITNEENLGENYAYEIPRGAATKEVEAGNVDPGTGNNASTNDSASNNSGIEQTATTKDSQTTAAPSQNANDNTTSVTIGKTKVKKVVRKKSAKKISVTLKKVNKASGYQVAVSTSKKFTKKTTITKNFSKRKTTFKSKKLKSNKKYYCRARAYKKVNGKKVFGKWTKAKKVKIKN